MYSLESIFTKVVLIGSDGRKTVKQDNIFFVVVIKGTYSKATM